jgi:hypothetical protein
MMMAPDTLWMLHFGTWLQPSCSRATALSGLAPAVEDVPELTGIHDKDATGKLCCSLLIVYEHWVVVVEMKEV